MNLLALLACGPLNLQLGHFPIALVQTPMKRLDSYIPERLPIVWETHVRDQELMDLDLTQQDPVLQIAAMTLGDQSSMFRAPVAIKWRQNVDARDLEELTPEDP